MDRKLIIIIAIFAIAIVAIFTFSQFNQQADTSPKVENGKLNTFFNFPASANGSSERTDQFYLKDSQGKPIAKANVSATYKSGGKDKTIIVTTDNEGYSKYVISDIDGDSGDIIYKYEGNDKYNGCEAKHSVENVKPSGKWDIQLWYLFNFF